ncbi:MAG: GNAT family N-acetyltransferase [Defluviitaleaceae bacterium]|nr:GNAT family N-acetyltransferase [Defluviitaleaceae bacterium]
MQLITNRLILREYAKNDKHNLYALFTEKFAFTYEAHLPKKISDMDVYLNFHLENAQTTNRTHYYYVIELQETHEFIGSIGYAFANEININGIDGWVMELEYYLLEKYWGMGYMPEALRKILSTAFEKNNILKIFAQCHKDNPKSEMVMIKCGMIKSTNQPEPKKYNGVVKENVRYEITADCFIPPHQ